MAKVIIDAGHGGNDPGDIYADRREKDDNLRLALAIGERLQNLYGISVGYTRTTDSYISQLDRVRIANSEDADLLISIHRITGDIPRPIPGLGFYIYSRGGLSEEAAINIGNELAPFFVDGYSITIRIDIPIIRDTEVPALMIGIGLINSETDNQIFDNYFEQIADAIAKGIARTLNPMMISYSEFIKPYFKFINPY